MTEIPFALPFLGAEEEEAALRVIRSLWLTTGKEALAFEEEFAAFISAGDDDSSGDDDSRGGGKLRAFAVNSATAGLHLALEACGAGPGDVAVCPALTFTATAEAARYLGAEVALVDVRPGTFHIDPAALELTLDRLSRGLSAYPGGSGPRGRPVAVLPVHYGGLPCDMEAILPLCRRYGAKVVEDAAHSFPSAIPGRGFAGTLGDAGVFSFYATKTITTGEGGMVVTRDEALGRRVSLMRLHGIDRQVWNRYTDRGASWRYDTAEPGYKYNMPDLLAAIGRVQLGRAWDLLARREEIARRYDEAFGGEPALSIPPTGPGDARHLYPLRIALPGDNRDGHYRGGLDRDGLIDTLKERGIGVSVHFIPLHLMGWYKKRYRFGEDDFPSALDSFRREISLPIWPGMTAAQVDRVTDEVLSLVHR